MLQSGYGVYLLPQRKRFKWDILYSMLIVAFVIHIFLFVLFGSLLPKLPKRKTKKFSVNLVKKPERKLVKTSKRKLMAHKLKDKRSAPPKKTRKPPQPKKQKPVVRPRVTKSRKAPPKLPVTIGLPKENYAKARRPAITYPNPSNNRPEGTGQDGPKVADEGGPPGVEGGTGDGSEGGGEEGGDGTGDGFGEGGQRPEVHWGYSGNQLGTGVLSEEERRGLYFSSLNTRPFLADAIVPQPRKLIGLGHGQVEFEITIPGVEEVSKGGIHPTNIKVISIRSDIPEAGLKMKEMALLSMQRSGWFPAKKDGKPVTETIRLTLYFFGTTFEK